MRRGQWTEFESDDPDEMVLVHPGWSNDRETLVLAIRETGWVHGNGVAYELAESASLRWGYLGVDEYGELQVCDALGQRGDDVLDEVGQVTFARLGSHEALAPRVPRNRDW